METLGQRIKRIRLEKGLTQKSLARKSGLTGGQISYYEQDLRTPCRRGEGINCNTAFRLYLESEMAPIPKLQKGDLIEFGSGKEVVYFENDFVWDFLKGNGVILTNITETDYKRIVSVRRVNERKQVNVIWQGGM